MSDPAWTIERFNSILDLDASGAFITREAIDVDFGSQRQPGITRDIVVIQTVDAGHARQFPISLLAVNDAQGRALPVESSTSSTVQRFQVGDPRAAVSGKQTYRLAYQVRRALTGTASYDELRWSVTGRWPVPIAASAIVVRPPNGAGILNGTCTQGAPSASKDECRASFTDKAATFTSTRALAAGEELTVDVRFAKGTFPEPQPLIIARAQTGGPPGQSRLALATEAVILALVFVVAAAWWRTRRSSSG